MSSLVLAGNFTELTSEEMFEVNGGWSWWDRASGPERGGSAVVGAGAGVVVQQTHAAAKIAAAAKTGAKIGVLAGPVGIAVGAIVGATAAAVIFTVFY